MKLNEKLREYLKIQVSVGKLSKEEVIKKYPEMEAELIDLD